MRLGLYSAIALVALPLMANAQSASQNLAQLEKAVRVQQWICTGIADVRARGGLYSPHQLALCLISLADLVSHVVRLSGPMIPSVVAGFQSQSKNIRQIFRRIITQVPEIRNGSEFAVIFL